MNSAELSDDPMTQFPVVHVCKQTIMSVLATLFINILSGFMDPHLRLPMWTSCTWSDILISLHSAYGLEGL